MGAALAQAAIDAGHHVIVVSGPVEVAYPAEAKVIPVISTEEMLAACRKVFSSCDGLIAVAAPCDYRPVAVAPRKIRKTGESLHLELVETPDIVAELASLKAAQWIVGFALETEDRRMRAMQKLERKNCDLIVVNGPDAIHAAETHVEILGRDGRLLGKFLGSKKEVAGNVFELIQRELIYPS
jgi:phosphopantothenoylcysteine decarboxylase/phosphopantothenate--cysteine ligase